MLMIGAIYFYNAYSQVTANANTNTESVSNQIYLNKVYIKLSNLYNCNYCVLILLKI